MKKALHGVSVNHCNLATQCRIAHETGYDALEILPDHLFRYLDNGGTLEKCRQLLQDYHIEVNCSEQWDQCVQRDYLPGKGEVDLAAWTRAVKATGYDGVWNPELLSPTHWEDDLWQIARECKARMDRVIG